MIEYLPLISPAVQVVGFVGGGYVLAMAVRSSVLDIRKDVDGMQQEIKKIGDVLVSIAVQKEQIETIKQEVHDIKYKCARFHEFPTEAGRIYGEG